MASWRDAAAPLCMSAILAIVLYPRFIHFLKGQPWRREVREDVPESHLAKTGTPSMGGLLFVTVTLVTAAAMAVATPRLQGMEVRALSITLLSFALIGFLDDWAKTRGNRGGIRARTKMLLQFLVALVMGAWALYVVRGNTSVFIPFVFLSIDLGWLYLPFLVLLFVATSNAANISDGMDGLCAGLTLVALIAFGVLAGRAQRSEIVAFCAALAGGLAGFLIFNAHPARIFMGDTGSQARGGAAAMIAILLKVELLLPFICLPWLVDTLSVMIQVAYFKLTRRLTGEGKRIFPITPIHHAFEKAGWSEWKVCGFFWTAGAISAALAVKWA